MCMFMYATPTFITEALRLVTQVELFLMTYSELTAYTVQHFLTLIELVSMTRFNSKVTPPTDNDYSCHIKAVELV